MVVAAGAGRLAASGHCGCSIAAAVGAALAPTRPGVPPAWRQEMVAAAGAGRHSASARRGWSIAVAVVAAPAPKRALVRAAPAPKDGCRELGLADYALTRPWGTDGSGLPSGLGKIVTWLLECAAAGHCRVRVRRPPGTHPVLTHPVLHPPPAHYTGPARQRILADPTSKPSDWPLAAPTVTFSRAKPPTSVPTVALTLTHAPTESLTITPSNSSSDKRSSASPSFLSAPASCPWSRQASRHCHVILTAKTQQARGQEDAGASGCCPWSVPAPEIPVVAFYDEAG